MNNKIEIRSREDAEKELGKFGVRAWDAGAEGQWGTDFEFVRPPKKLEPLTDEELGSIYKNHPGIRSRSARAVVEAHETRQREIALAENSHRRGEAVF